jgi:transglutaminase-like putative cysteine protease
MQRLWATLRDDLPTLVLVAALMLIAVWSVIVADWVTGLAVLPAIMLISLVTGYLLATSSFSELFVLLATSFYGWFTVFALVGQQLPGDLGLRGRLLELTFRLSVWFERALGGGFSRDNLIFLLIIGLLTWYLTFNAVWGVFRRGRLWSAIVPAGLAMIINIYHYFGPIRVELFVVAFLFLMLVLAVRTNAVDRERLWQREGAGFAPGARSSLFRGGLAAIVMLLGLAYFAPEASANEQLSALWEDSDNPWMGIRETFNRLFNAIEGPYSVTPTYYGGSSLAMGGPINLSDQPIMIAFAPEGYRYYWRSKVFETYADGHWQSDAETRTNSDFGLLLAEESAAYQLRQNVQQRFQIVGPSMRLLYAAPQPLSFPSLPITSDLIYTTPGTDYATVTSAQSREVLNSGDVYGATSAISIADEASLSTAGTDYPAWITDRYLGLPGSITQRTRTLAADLTAAAPTPYQAARVVENYLRTTMRYNESVQAPPSDAEPVDYFLFETQEGYCTYYASAMVILLRAQGIPSRLAAGFAQGEYDPETGGFLVIESDAHTWAQVYFPGYGWIDFEPTSAQPAIERNDQLAAGDFPEPDAPNLQDLPDPAEELRPEAVEVGPTGVMPGQGMPLAVLGRMLGALRWVLALGVVAVVVVIGTWLWRTEFRLRDLGPVARTYARLNVFAPMVGVNVEPSDTPAERAEAFNQTLPESRYPVKEIVDLHVAEQYTLRGLEGRQAEANTRVRTAWLELRRVFLRAGVGRRLRRLNPFHRDDVTIR